MELDSTDNVIRNLYKSHLDIKYNFGLSQNKSAFFITNPKIGSRYITHALGKDTTQFTIKLPSGELEPYVGDTSDLKYIHDISTDWANILNKSIKKDIVVLYRDPLKRLVSAIIQDSLHLLETGEAIAVLYDAFLEKGYSESDIDNLINWKLSAHPSDSEFVERYDMDIDMSNIPKMIYEVYKLYINNLFRREDIETTHAKSHNLPLVVLLNCINMDTSKIKFIDLDNTPNEFENYLTSIGMDFPKNKHSNNIFGKDMVYNLLKTTTNYRLRDALKGEMMAYTILQSYHN